MKITSIELTNHLSHVATHVSFDGARLVTFSGPNGAGKSGLLEAMKYVLFDDGRGRTDDLVRLGAMDMAASIEFGFAGGHYRATRGRTTRAGGKSYLELAIAGADGSWTSLTGDDIRTTQGRIRELLGMDAETFATAVFLGQGDANRFAGATGGERKKILGQVLGLERYERAERIARDRTRDAEARTAIARDQITRLDERLGVRPGFEEALAEKRQTLAEIDDSLTDRRTLRDGRQATVVELTGRLATFEAAERDVVAIEGRLAGIRERFTRTRDRRRVADATRQAAQVTLGRTADVERAAAALPDARAALAALEAGATSERLLDDELHKARIAAAARRATFDLDLATWQTRYEGARRRTDDLAAQVTALEPVVCEKCGHPNIVDQAGLRGQLDAARAEYRGHEAARPAEPYDLGRDRAAIARLERKLADAKPDVDALLAARGRVLELERAAARAEAIEAARSAVERETAAIAAADEDLGILDAEGKAAAGEFTSARERAGQADEVRADLARVKQYLEEALAEITGLDALRAAAGAEIATLEANLTELDRAATERKETRAAIASADVEIGRLRRLVAAFGVGGIPARIIEGVLPELASHANDLLASLRPGMTLDLRAQRAKRDGKGVVEALDLVVRDAVGERPLAMFSGGERMSVSLAVAVGLSRLVARRAGTAIRTLVIDEPDGLDADARRAFGQALRVLAHRGDLELVVLVSHHEDLADVGDAAYRVSKNGAGSVVELVG